MEREMRALGLIPPSKDKSLTVKDTFTIDDSPHLNNTNEVVIQVDDSANNCDFDRIDSINTIRLKNRRNTIGPFEAKNNLNLKVPNQNRRYSLDVSNHVNSYGRPTLSFVKHLNRSDLSLIEDVTEPILERHSNLTPRSSIEILSPYPRVYSPTKTEQDLNTTQMSFQKINRNFDSALTNQSNRTNFTNLSNMTSSSLRRTSLRSNSNYNFPKIRRKSSNKQKNEDKEASKRHVSFGQIELSQLEIPTVYKYSNVGFERYKLNPHFYLPDGSLKRKFSLPKLNETLEAVKDCRYLRRNSIESNENVDVKNIFQDLESSSSQNDLRNFDTLSEKSD